MTVFYSPYFIPDRSIKSNFELKYRFRVLNRTNDSPTFISLKESDFGVCVVGSGSQTEVGPLFLVVSLLHGSIFPQVVESLQLMDDKVSFGHQSLDFLRIRLVFVLHEGRLEALSEISGAFGVFSAQIEELLRRKHVLDMNMYVLQLQ